MRFGLTQEQEMIRAQANEFLKKECPTSVVRALMEEPHAFSVDLWEKMSGLGWTGLVIPEQYGGEGLSFVELAVLLEEMGGALVPGAYFSSILAGLLLLEAGNEEQKQTWLPKLAKGKARATLAVAEYGASWNPASIASTASQSSAGYVVNGTKLFVPDAHAADVIIAAVKTGGPSGAADGISLVLIDPNAEGVSITPLKATDQTRRLYEVKFEGVRITTGQMLGTPGYVSTSLAKVLDKAAIALCAEMVGGAQRVLDMCVEFTKSRVQFGRPIGSFQSIQHRCADMMLAVESSRSAVYAAAWAASEEKDDLPLYASIAKAYTSDTYSTVSAQAIQIHGGMGFTWEHDAHLYLKRAKADQFTYGDAVYHRERVAALIGL